MRASKKILPANQDSLGKCAELLREDELVAVPTETVYGLAGNALSEDAVRKIFEVKGRPLIDPLISHFKNAKSAFEHVEAAEVAERLADAFWPGPLTLVLPKRESIPDLVTAGLPTAAIRVPSHPVLRELLCKLEFPLAAPSANPFGYVSPTRPEHVEKTLGSRIAAILDGGPCMHGLESTVLDLRDPDEPTILRPGPITLQEIEQKTGLKVGTLQKATEDGSPQTAPGLLSKHYSPHTDIVLFRNGRGSEIVPTKGDALILNRKPEQVSGNDTYWLSEDGNLGDIARSFFDLIQKLDRRNYGRLLIEAAPDSGLGVAINDRLKRAAR